jgi:DNA-binding transcriptional MerR regulator
MDKSPDAFRTISEVAESLDLPQHVLRFWESRFPQIKPMKRGGGRRYYRPDDVELLRAIKHLLYDEGYTIKGVQRLFKEQGARALASRPISVEEGAAHETAPTQFAEPAPLGASEEGSSRR